jgi:hypothetical protein
MNALVSFLTIFNSARACDANKNTIQRLVVTQRSQKRDDLMSLGTLLKNIWVENTVSENYETGSEIFRRLIRDDLNPRM